jgi:DNA-binding SARP family transcriptional activator
VRRYVSRVVRICVLGELEVESDGKPVELSGSWRAQSLFAWLAVHPGTHPRSSVAPRFWPDVLDSSARASLRNALWSIRKALGGDAELLIATRDRIGLEGPPAVWVDALAFDELVREDRWEESLELVRGEPLEGLDDEWVYEFRDEHRERLSGLLEKLAAQAEGDKALGWSRRRVALDPLDEDAQRALISRLIDAGDRPGALAAYGRLRQRLRTELGISPSAETRNLVLELQADDGRGAGAPETSLPAPGADDPWSPGTGFPMPPRLRGAADDLIGRSPELSQLRDLWTRTKEAQTARLARLTGDAGIGKSRLARELATGASADGAIVLFGSADGDRLIPHQIWAEALEHLRSELGDAELRRRLGSRAADIDPVLPRLAGDPIVDESEPGASGESRIYRLFEAVRALLESVSDDAPVLLVADDIHWADDSTVALMRHVLERGRGARILIVATQRDEAPTEGALAEALSRLAREELADEIALTGLPESEVAELSQRLSEGELSDELVGAIARESAGNPFFVGELVRHLDESEGGTSVLSLTQAKVPERVREVVNLRLARLSDPAVRLLSVAAVIGNEFDLSLLEDVGSSRGDEALALLEEGLDAQLISELDYDDRDAFAFSHVLLRRTLLQRLPRVSRRRVHARVAEALEADRGEEALLDIAHHMCEARNATDRERALDFATRAAESAIADLAYAEAVDLFTRARALLPGGDPRRRTLALKRAVAYQALFHAVYDAAAGEARTGTFEPPA